MSRAVRPADLETDDDENDPLVKAVREVQMTVELTIENLRMVRADLDNTVADLLEQRTTADRMRRPVK